MGNEIIIKDLNKTEKTLRTEMKNLGKNLQAETKELGASLRAEIKELGVSLRAETKELGVNLRAEMKESTNEILEEISIFSTSIDKKFNQIESRMVTKDYLDRKLWEVRGDMHNMMKDHVAEMH